MQEVISVVSFPIDDFPYVEIVPNHEVARHSSQFCKDEAAKIYASSDEGKVVDSMCNKEAS